MASDYKKAYSKGYNAGARGLWPEHRPPHPPHELIGRLMDSVLKLRDAVDGELATLDKDDPWQTILGDPMDIVDELLVEVGVWLTAESPSTDQTNSQQKIAR